MITELYLERSTVAIVMEALVNGRIPREAAYHLVLPWAEGDGECDNLAFSGAMDLHGSDMFAVNQEGQVYSRHRGDGERDFCGEYIVPREALIDRIGNWMARAGFAWRPACGPEEVEGELDACLTVSGFRLERNAVAVFLEALAYGRISRESAHRLVVPWVEGPADGDDLAILGAMEIYNADVISLADGRSLHQGVHYLEGYEFNMCQECVVERAKEWMKRADIAWAGPALRDE